MSPSDRDDALAAVASCQAGVFTRRDAITAGFGVSDIERRVDVGAWVAIHPGVYRAATTPMTRQVAAVAHLLRVGGLAMFSHVTAARLLGVDLRSDSTRTWVTTSVRSPYRRDDALVLTRTRHLPTPVLRHGYPVTDVPRLMVDLAGVVDRERLSATLYDVVRTGAVTMEQVGEEADRIGGGRAGLRVLRDVAAEFDPSFDSAAEASALGSLRGAGIEMQPQYEIWDGPFLVARIDLADPVLKLGLEVDGFAYHSSRAAIARDRRRDRGLGRRGWTIHRFAATEVMNRPRLFVAEVLAIREELIQRGGDRAS